MRNAKGQFIAGLPLENRLPIGTIRVRTRYNRGHDQRAYIKIAEPNTWVLLARYRWEQAHGPIPRGVGIHHKDEYTLNDALDNLELVTKAEHLALHRPTFRDKATARWIQTRRERRWTTRSTTKQTGHPRSYTEDALLCAIGAYFTTTRTMADIAEEYGIPITSFRKKMRVVRDDIAASDVHG